MPIFPPSTSSPTSSEFILKPTVTVTDYGAGRGDADDVPYFVAAIAAAKGRPVMVPNVGIPYNFNQHLLLPANTTILGVGNPVIQYVALGQSNVGVLQTAGVNVTVKSLTIDGGKLLATPPGSNTFGLNVKHAGFLGEELVVRNARGRGVDFYITSKGRMINCKVVDNDGVGIRLNNCYEIDIIDVDVSRNYNSFGIWPVGGTHDCLLQGITMRNNANPWVSLECIGVTSNCYRIRILNCFAEGSGDNGISVTGKHCIVANCQVFNSSQGGIVLYGSFNTATGNTSGNNNQSVAWDPTSKKGGIDMPPSWGGLASHNTVTGNICFDDQATPTQYSGINIRHNCYGFWTAGQVLPDNNTYRYYGNNAYKPTTGGTCGSTPPTHTSGTVSDGGVSWTFVVTNEGGTFDAVGNTVVGNATYGNKVNTVWLESEAANVVTNNT